MKTKYLNIFIKNKGQNYLEVALDGKIINLHCDGINETYKYYNLPYFDKYEIGDSKSVSILELWDSDSRYYNYIQTNFMKEVKEKNGIYYVENIIGIPKKIIFTFPGYADANFDHTYPHYEFRSLQTKLSDVVIVSLFDNYCTTGTFMV